MRIASSCLVLSWLVLGPACTRSPAQTQPPVVTTEPVQEVTPGPAVKLDRARLQADIEWLSSDALAGRFTLAPELAVAAEFLAGRHRELGLVPTAGSSFLVDFPIAVGVKSIQPPTLSLVRTGKPTPVAETAFALVPQTGSGSVRGPAVFVGYGRCLEAIAAWGHDPAGQAALCRAGLGRLVGRYEEPIEYAPDADGRIVAAGRASRDRDQRP